MDDKQQKLEALIALVDRKTIVEEDFVAAFQQIVDFIKQTNNATASVLEDVFARLDTFSQELKGDAEQDRTLVKQAVGQAMAELRTTLDARMAEIQDGKTPVKGVDYFDGKPADEESIVNVVLSKLPPPKEIETETPQTIVEKINRSSLLIAKERIEGLVDLMGNMAAQAVSAVGITTTNFFRNNTLIGRAKNINFIEGLGVSLSLYQTGDQMNVSVSTTTSTSVGFQQPTGVVDGSNTVFVFAQAPNAISVDNGRAIQKVSNDGTINWTGTTTVTLSVAPTFDIFGIS